MQTSNSKMTLASVLQERVDSGLSIFQGSRPSRPLEKILAQLNCDIRPYFVDLKEQNQILEYCKEDQVISVETGLTLGDLAEVLGPNGQYLPIFGKPDQSLLELINDGDSGYFEHSYGLRALVLGLQVVLSSGDTIKTGGKVVKNVSGYDLTKLFLGARGTLGIPTRAHLRVFALHEQTEVFVIHGVALSELLSLAGRLVHSGLPLAGVELVSGGSTPIVDKLPIDFLLVSVSEDRDVVSELKPLLEALFRDAGAAVLSAESSVHDELHMVLNDYFAWDTNILSSSLSRVQMQKLLPVLTEGAQTQLLYRPGTGRLTARFADGPDLKNVMNRLPLAVRPTSVTASDEGLELIDVAYADTELEFRVERLDGGDSEILKIKQQIKKKFDPLNKMNPLAKM
jgi:glycolate oxidase FAD binding subunit